MEYPMKNSDQAHFYKIIRKLPDQIRESAELVQRIDLSLLPDSFDLVLLTGMGGSAITGDLMAAFLQNTVTIPFLVNRNYTLPGFVNKRSLVLASSYSGNTEETLAATQVAVERGATV
ncbi:MAG TPA: SIS domain-containing protein, partial [Caldithrix sp.]|nr:SIS domain-containing protein [Caldithrix sp.]